MFYFEQNERWEYDRLTGITGSLIASRWIIFEKVSIMEEEV